MTSFLTAESIPAETSDQKAGSLPIAEVFPLVATFPEHGIEGTAGERLRTITPEDWTGGVLYPHTRSWSADGRWLFFSAIPALQESSVPTGDIWILAADMAEGNIHRLATIPNEAGFPNTQIFNQADVAPEAGWLVYFQRHDNAIHMLNLRTGEDRRVFVENSGTLGEPPSISPDASRIAWFSRFQGPSGDWFAGATGAVFFMDMDPQTGLPKGRPQIVYSLPRMRVSGGEAFRNFVSLSHVQLNPSNPDQIAYARGSYAAADGSIALSRMWTVDASGYPNELLARTEKGTYHTHELWSDDGEWMYFIDTGKLARIPAEGGDIETIAEGLNPPALHLSMSRDNQTITYDARIPGRGPSSNRDPKDYPVEVWVYATGTEQLTRVATTFNNEGFHSHAHPKISPDGAKVAFTAVDGPRRAVVVADLRDDAMRDANAATPETPKE